MNENKEKEITFFVNGEELSTSDHKLTVADILKEASCDPPENYRLIRDNGNHTYSDYAEEIPLHKGERFTAIFNGQTPVS